MNASYQNPPALAGGARPSDPLPTAFAHDVARSPHHEAMLSLESQAHALREALDALRKKLERSMHTAEPRSDQSSKPTAVHPVPVIAHVEQVGEIVGRCHAIVADILDRLAV